jgi:hypothetical protein
MQRNKGMVKFKTTIRALLPILFVVSGTLITGCGGGGSSQPSQFIGTWSGFWSVPSASKQEPLTLTVDPTGKASGHVGVVTGNIPPEDFGVQGTISSDGMVDMHIENSGPNPLPSPTRLNGKFYVRDTRVMFGTLIGSNEGIPQFAVAVQLQRQ